MFEVYSHGRGDLPWEVRPVSPHQFRQMDEDRAMNCFWREEDAIMEMQARNRWEIQQLRRRAEAFEKAAGGSRA